MSDGEKLVISSFARPERDGVRRGREQSQQTLTCDKVVRRQNNVFKYSKTSKKLLDFCAIMYVMKKWDATWFLFQSGLAFIFAAGWHSIDGAKVIGFYSGFEVLAMLFWIIGAVKLMKERKEK